MLRVIPESETAEKLSTRAKLFQKNYTMLKKFAPGMLEDTAPAFTLQHIGRIDPRIRTYAERYDDTRLVRIGTDWPINGEPSCDPLIDVMFDNELKMARVRYWVMENLMYKLLNGGSPICEAFSCTFDSEETQKEREANEFLCEWLTEITKDWSPKFFQKKPIIW